MFALFLIGAVSLYAALHTYVYRRINAVWNVPLRTRLLLVSLFLLLIILPFAGRLLDHNGHALLARFVNLTAFLWMVWVFWFCMAGWTLGLWNLLFRRFRLSPRVHGGISVLMVIAATLWGFLESSHPTLTKLNFIAPGLPHDSPPLRIVQVSDVHLGTVRSTRWNQSLVAEIRALAPDLILSTGDFVDSSVRNVAPLADAWATLSPPLGKYAILGNHEFYTGVADAVALHQEAGFQLLRASGVNVNEALSLYGVDDPAGQYLGLADFTSEAQLPLHAPRARFTILLKHQPRINPFSIGRFDLQLSGHTHGGQVFPFHLVARLIYPFTTGHFDIGQHSHLYVSRGTGTWGPPLRFLAPPEITVITLSPPP